MVNNTVQKNMRTALKTIAIIQAVLGGFILVAGCAMCVAGIMSQKSVLLPIVLTLVTMIVGGVILIGARRYIRTPSRTTAGDIASSTAVLLWMFGSAPVLKYFDTKNESTDISHSVMPLLMTIGIPYLIYRFVLKRMAETAFKNENRGA